MRVSPFAHDFNHVSSYSAGLYLTESNTNGAHPFEDGSKLVLSFPLGSNAFARTSDGALIGGNIRSTGEIAEAEIEPRSMELYQLGFNHSITTHDLQLRYVLWEWVEMVEWGNDRWTRMALWPV